LCIKPDAVFAIGLKRGRQTRLAKKFVLRHLERYPLPGDTLAGISKSWLEETRIEIAVEEVADALNELLKERKIERRQVGADVLFVKTHMGRKGILSLIAV